jgi:hypothetical protein
MVNYQQKKPKHSITAGADPEFFLRSGKVFIPSTKIIGGTKKSPIPIPGLPDGFSMQEDNIMGEFNIPPCKDAKTFSHSIGIALKSISELIPSNTEIVIQPSAVFKPKFTKTRAAKVFGCDPDINAWTESPNRFMPAEDPNLRCCGGHIHVGLPNELMGYTSRHDVIRAMDVFLGLPSIIMDKDTKRREMYGKAGSFRQKSYGVEYRTLSNFWIQTEALREWAFESTQVAVDSSTEPAFMESILKNKDAIIEAINFQDVNAATDLCNHYNVTVL